MNTIKLKNVDALKGIIGYYVSDSTGLAILTNCERRWGFQYVFSRHMNLKFETTHPAQAIKAAIRGGRAVFLCNTWDEAMQYALSCKGTREPEEKLIDLRRHDNTES